MNPIATARRLLAAGRDGPPDIWAQPFRPEASVEDIGYCFRLLLGRRPNREEWRGHAMRAGEPLPGVVASYLSSLEFSRRGLLAQDHMSGVALAELPEFRIYAAADDAAVGRYVREDNYEREVAAVFRRTLRPGMGVIDIGANIGYFTMLSAALVGAGGYVLAVEPNARNARMVEASRLANGFEQVAVAQVAAGPRPGLLALHATHSNGMTSTLPGDPVALLGAETVQCLPPDLLVPARRRIDLIKADVEGAEYLALQGCREVIGRDRPIIISEFSPGLMPGISGVDGPFYLRWLQGLGYDLSAVAPDGTLIPMPRPEDAMSLHHSRATDHIDIVAEPA